MLSAIASRLKSVWSSSTQALPAQIDPMPHRLEQFVKQFNKRPGSSMILGSPRSGKSHFINKVAQHLEGCVVHIKASSEVQAGWEEAPFYGSLQLTDSTACEFLDLPDVLTPRQSGYFSLEIPSFVLLNDISRAEQMRDALWGILCAPLLMPPAAARVAPRLVLIVDSALDFLTQDATSSLLRYGRQSNYHVIFALEENPFEDQENLMQAMTHVVIMPSKNSSYDEVAQAMGLQPYALDRLKQGQCWHRVVPTGELELLLIPAPESVSE